MIREYVWMWKVLVLKIWGVAKSILHIFALLILILYGADIGAKIGYEYYRTVLRGIDPYQGPTQIRLIVESTFGGALSGVLITLYGYILISNHRYYFYAAAFIFNFTFVLAGQVILYKELADLPSWLLTSSAFLLSSLLVIMFSAFIHRLLKTIR